MRRIAMVPIMMFLFLVAGTTASEKPQPISGFRVKTLGDQVLTIYFCGTGNTENGPINGWGGQKPAHELISWLYATDTSDSVNDSKEPWGTHHKTILDGVGTRGNLLQQALNQVDPNLPPRGWKQILEEAKNAYKAALKKKPSQSLILNLVGFSRGAVLTMMMAHWVENGKDQTKENKERTSRINIIAFDPVPLDYIFNYEYLCLGEKVERYVGFYAEHEKTNRFFTVIPDFKSNKTQARMFSLPGKHETLVGNPQIDGSAWSWDKRVNYDILDISWVARVMAVEFLRSPQWGKITFDFTKTFFSDPCINPGAFRWVRDKKTFKEKIHSIWHPTDFLRYVYMNSSETAPMGGWQTYGLVFCNYYDWISWWKIANLPQQLLTRCVYRMKCGWIGYMHGLDLQQDIHRINSDNALKALRELGGTVLDKEYDSVKCPPPSAPAGLIVE